MMACAHPALATMACRHSVIRAGDANGSLAAMLVFAFTKLYPRMLAVKGNAEPGYMLK